MDSSAVEKLVATMDDKLEISLVVQLALKTVAWMGDDWVFCWALTTASIEVGVTAA